MTAAILNGKALALMMRQQMSQRISQRLAEGVRRPCLAALLIGEDEASQIYVNHKRHACKEIGIHTEVHRLDADIKESSVQALLQQLNASPDVDGILVQLPLPPTISAERIIEGIDPQKDVDGFHPINMGRLALGHPRLRPCTPWGIIQLLEHYKINLSGLSALVVGASTIVGRPMALELLMAKATVTVAHSKTRHLNQLVQAADLIISATGVGNLIHLDDLRPHQIIVDVGIRRSKDLGLCGDIDTLQAQERVAWITPVPGGVGPMTVASLLSNTLYCWETRLGLNS